MNESDPRNQLDLLKHIERAPTPLLSYLPDGSGRRVRANGRMKK